MEPADDSLNKTQIFLFLRFNLIRHFAVMQFNIVNSSNNPLPAYETKNSAGMDLRAYLPDGPITLEPLQRALVPTWKSPKATKGKCGLAAAWH